MISLVVLNKNIDEWTLERSNQLNQFNLIFTCMKNNVDITTLEYRKTVCRVELE